MAYVFELFFAEPGETTVRQQWQALADTGVNDYMTRVGSTPHITLGGFEDDSLDESLLLEKMAQFAHNIVAFPLTLSYLGVFNTNPAVVYAGATMSLALLEAHRFFHMLFDDVGERPFAYYLPDIWVPHCTLAEQVKPTHVGNTLTHCQALALPLQTTVTHIGLVRPRTRPVAKLGVIELS
ncbi:MAG: 2'-5' RNA ligase family protein [Chloroflexota bacterium]